MVVTWAYNAGTNTATASGAGSTNFAALVAADTAGGWGKFTADATGTQISCAAKIVVGDGTNACIFSDASLHIVFAAAVAASALRVRANSTATFGVLIDATTKTTRAGCSFLVAARAYAYNYWLIEGTLNLYSCKVQHGSTTVLLSLHNNGGSVTLYNCVFPQNFGFYAGTYNIYNITVQYVRGDSAFVRGQGTFDKLFVTNCNKGAFKPQYGDALTISNAISIGNVPFVETWNSTGNCSFIDCVVDNWDFTFGGTSTGLMYRKHSFSCYILDSDGDPIEDATVTMTDNASTEVFSEDTDGSGFITVQTVTRGYYDQAHSDTLQDAGPHTLTVTKTGYIPYTCTFNLEQKLTEFPITLHPQLTGDASEADVATGKTFYSTDADTIQTGTYTPEPPGGGFYFPVEKKVTVEKIVEKPLNKTLLLLSSNLILQKWKLKRALLLENMLTAQKINKLTENIKKGK